MKDIILVILLVLLVANLFIQEFTQKPDRYEVVTGANMLTILVDKKTGDTWRNCICGEKSNVPGCWEKMVTLNPESFNKPIGEVESFKKMEKLLKKQAEQQKSENK